MPNLSGFSLPNGVAPQNTAAPIVPGLMPISPPAPVIDAAGSTQPCSALSIVPPSPAEAQACAVLSIIPPPAGSTEAAPSLSLVDTLIQQKDAYERLMGDHIAQMKLRHQQEQLALAAYHQQMALQRASLAVTSAAMPGLTLGGATPSLQSMALATAPAASAAAFAGLVPENIAGVTDIKFQGRIKMIKEDKTYGFIGNPPELAEKFTKKDVFLHRTEAATYQVGDLVSFGVRLHTDGRPQAKDVELVTPASALPPPTGPAVIDLSAPALLPMVTLPGA